MNESIIAGRSPPGRNRVLEVSLHARKTLAEGRHRWYERHQQGAPGIQVCAGLTELWDSIVLSIFQVAIEQAGDRAPRLADRVALVAHGGYGRAETAPFSDVDLMLLRRGVSEADVRPLASALLRGLTDSGLTMGFSLRTVADACARSLRDPIVLSSLIDSRFLAGSETLFAVFQRRFAAKVRRHPRRRILEIESARREERAKYGETVYLLEPNVKRSDGGLRDLALVRWVGYLRYGELQLDHLQRGGWLSAQDHATLRKSQEFLLRLRNQMHFCTGLPTDTLSRELQEQMAPWNHCTGREGLLPVEEFMQRYFRHTSSVRHIAAHLVEGAKWTTPWHRIVRFFASRNIDPDFRLGPIHLRVTPKSLPQIANSLSGVLRLMDLANTYNRRIDWPTWEAIRTTMLAGSHYVIDEEVARRFRSLLSQPCRLGQLLRRLQELQVLGKLIPSFEHARGLLQFNHMHHYTVDEHCIRAVECATEFAAEESWIGQAYRQIKNKELLHLALLLHDIGKGYAVDHSEVGGEIALDVARTLRLSERETETLHFLVRHHLMLSDLAFYRNVNDEALVLRQSVEIGSPSLMRMMFVLTCADLAAVGPGMLTQWRKMILHDLYRRMIDYVTGETTAPDVARRLDCQRQQLLSQLGRDDDRTWMQRQISVLPQAYLEGPSARWLLDDLRRLRQMAPGAVTAWGRYLEDQHVAEYSVGTYESITRGIFHRLTGALTSNGLKILSAEIHTLRDDLVFDRFYVQDDDYRGEPPEERFQRVEHDLRRSLLDSATYEPTFGERWTVGDSRRRSVTHRLPTRVRIDNTTSESYTIVDVFTQDRSGLLYTITRTLFVLDLSVHHARIGTYRDQVVDVFYVTDSDGRKVHDEERLQRICDQLLAAIDVPLANRVRQVV